MKRLLLVGGVILGLVLIYLIVNVFTFQSLEQNGLTVPPGIEGPTSPPSQTGPTTPPPGIVEGEFNPAQESRGPTEPPPPPLYP